MHQVILKTDVIRQMVRAAVMTEYNAKIQEIERRLSAAEEELRVLKAGDNKGNAPEPPHPRWYPPLPSPHSRPYPENNQVYFYVNDMGEVDETKWTSDRFDLGAHEIGNVFVTENAAVFAAERLKVLAEMHEWAGRWDDKYTLRYDEKTGIEPYIHVYPYKSYGEMRFATKLDAECCIKAVGEDRLIKYYFGVRDHEIPA